MMPSVTHVLETSLLMLVAYVLGCSIGYAVHRILYAGRGTHKATAAAAGVSPSTADTALRSRRTMSPAARLAAAGSDEPVMLPAASVSFSPPGALRQSTAAVDKPATPRPTTPGSGPSLPRPVEGGISPRPAQMTAPRSGGPDNLKQIKGIGPKIEASLNGLGIYHFDQIAAWSKANVEWVDKQLAFRGRIMRERWVEQAAELARPSRISA